MSASDTRRAATEGRPREIEAVSVRHPGRWVAAVVVLVLAAMLAHSFVANPRWQWDVIGSYLFDRTILSGLVLTLELTAIAMLIGIALGIILAVLRLSPNPVVSGGSWLYIWFFRGTPVIVQLLFWYYIAALFPQLSFGIPFGPHFVDASTTKLISQFTAAILGLGLNEAAYMSEIVRAGIVSVDPGQQEASLALGMTRAQAMRRIVLPQAMRVIIPPTGNETISMLKTTSLVIVIALGDLLTNAQIIYSRNYLQIPLLLVASLWYLFVTSVLTVGQYYVERRYARGAARALPDTPLQKLRRNLTSVRRQPTAGLALTGGTTIDLPEEHR